MAQLVILTVLGFKNLKRRLFAPFRRGILAALLLCTVWAAQAQNLTVSINGGTALTNKASLQTAIEGSGLELNAITSLEISAGNFTTEDWNYLSSNNTNLRLKSFIITDGISSVADMPDDEWKNHSSITSVSIDAKFAIGNNAFYGCSNLTTVSLPQDTSIGNNAFYGCSKLTTVSLPLATSIGDGVFRECSNLTTVSLPLVTSIGDGVFEKCSKLTAVSLPQATSIGYHAFIVCVALTTVSLPQVTSIGTSAFFDCYNLITVSLPKATSIDFRAFENCRSLTSLELSATPPTVENYAFRNCHSLRYLKVDANAVETYKNVDDGDNSDNLWYGWRINEYPTKLTVKVNGGDAISNQISLQSAIEASGVTADDIRQLEIVSGDFMPADAAYMRTLKVEQITMSTEIDELGVQFRHSTLREFNGPNVKSIGYEAFCNCSKLTTVSLPQATSIGDRAFRDCSNLTTISLPQATSIGDLAFYFCGKLTTVSLPKATKFGNVFSFCANLTTVSLPRATSISGMTFHYCRSLAFLELGATPPNLDNNAFNRCPSPRYLTLVDADGNPLTGTARQNAFANYKNDSNWDSNTSTWRGWSLMFSIAATAYPTEGGTVSGAGRVVSGAVVTLEATPNEGYRFVRWSANGNELSTEATFSFSATSDSVLVAEFEVITYTLNYTASTGGSISGTSTQTIVHGQNGIEVEAVANEGYKFVRWSDGDTTAKRTDANVMKDLNVQAEFVDKNTNIYILEYAVGDGGKIIGPATQRVADGQSSIEVEAVPNEGYKFVRWSDGLTTAKRTDSNVQGDINATAEFELITYMLTYTAGDGGSIKGVNKQTVREGESGTEVEAVANEGYKFVKWSDGLTTAKRTDSNVKANLSVKAEFEKTSTTGLFDTQLDALSVYPNPTAGAVQLEATGEVFVSNVAGQLLQRVPSQGKVLIDLSAYPAGVYIIRVGNAVAKVLKQ